MNIFKENDVIVFQGDSVTDCLRMQDDPHDMSRGYAHTIASLYQAEHPGTHLTFYNRGVGGDRTSHLKERWQRDCIDLKPTWVSILVGINNVIGKYVLNDPTPTETFVAEYRYLLDQTLEKLDNPKIVLCEPFYYPAKPGEPFYMERWTGDFIEKVAAIKELAYEYKTFYVPLHGIFLNAINKQSWEYWLQDGIHPTSAGHGLIAKAWLDCVGEQF